MAACSLLYTTNIVTACSFVDVPISVNSMCDELTDWRKLSLGEDVSFINENTAIYQIKHPSPGKDLKEMETKKCRPFTKEMKKNQMKSDLP